MNFQHPKDKVLFPFLKKGKDKRYIRNWRPVTLLNVDYKIVTKCLAKRLDKKIPVLIHETQSAFVRNRYIGDVIRLIEEVMNYTEHMNLPGILITVDLEKAFDSLEWSYLFKVLKTFDFGQSFINWIKTCYKNSESCVMNKGTSTGYFKLFRGVRQGDCISPMLFVLALEIFLISLRSEKNIKGIDVHGEEIKNSSFADDLTCFIQDEQSASNLFKLLDRFTSVSGLKVNVNKNEAMWLGKQKHCKDKPLGVKWPDDPIKIVGIYISYDRERALQMNLAEPLEKLRCSLNFWKSRDLTILGKIQIIKTMGISRVQYVMNMIEILCSELKKVNSLIY